MWLNPFITALLHSPFFWPACKRFLLLTVTGRKTGRAFTLPVFYNRQGDRLLFISHPERRWWRNLRGGAPVTVWLCGRARPGQGVVLDWELPARRALIRRLYWMLPPARADWLAQTAVVLQVQLTPAKP